MFGSSIDRHASRSTRVDFTFAFLVTSTDRIESISCGYGVSDYIVKKTRSMPAVVLQKYAGKAEIVSDNAGKSLTFRLKNLTVKDSRNGLWCLLLYERKSYHSGAYNLKVYSKFYLL